MITIQCHRLDKDVNDLLMHTLPDLSSRAEILHVSLGAVWNTFRSGDVLLVNTESTSLFPFLKNE